MTDLEKLMKMGAQAVCGNLFLRGKHVGIFADSFIATADGEAELLNFAGDAEDAVIVSESPVPMTAEEVKPVEPPRPKRGRKAAKAEAVDVPHVDVPDFTGLGE